ncbi:MAG TPA: glycoside hydrolase family 3 N-terminal domain-containing protein [Gemmatimonadaceae bacterium]|nr:glycoside hydrolase family 3 N-terminal domain-containing protein [Gemmatimonadaceae bacterium]
MPRFPLPASRRRGSAAPLPALLAALAIAGCATAGTRPAATTAPPSASAACASRAGSDRWVDCVLSHMTLREKAAQMVWPQVYGDYVPTDAAQWRRLSGYIARDHVGGIIMSVGSPIEIADKLNAFQRMSDVPLLVGADLEAGAGFRARGGWFLPNGIDLGGSVIFPPQMAIGATGDTTLAYEQGRVTAIEGRALGIHIAFAPVLDVNNNPANPVINTRSFGEDPAAVARMGTAFIDGLQANGMIATGKHFPGHGDTGVNSHLALPVVRVSRARLDSVELVPFRAAIRAGVGAIMTFHGSMPALDSSGVPGTLSHKVLTGLLRDELGFRGLVITDAMEMRGVLDTYGPVEAAKRAVAAGADVLLQPLDATQTIDAVVDGVREGRYDEARLDRSVRRILEAKHQVALDRRRTVDLDSVRAVVGDSAHEAVAALAAERSITLVKDSLRQLPLGRLVRGARVLSITYAHRTDLGAGTTFDAELRRAFPALRSELVSADEAAPDYQRLLQMADSADVVLVSPYVSHGTTVTSVSAPAAFVSFVEALQARGAHPVVVAFGNPYFLQQIPDVGTYVVAWGGFAVSQRAAARAVLGMAPITGHLPIGIPQAAALGAGETRPAAAVSGVK